MILCHLVVQISSFYLTAKNFMHLKTIGFNQQLYLKVKTKEFKKSNHLVNVTMASGCWSSPIPCVLFPGDLKEFEFRSEKIQDGFRAKKE